MRRKKINLKAIVCALMSSAMILTLVTPASAATARATTMKLEKTEGTVTLKTQNGSARKITKGMRLYNGNTLSTAKYSYAHISLDSTKAVKLDQSSSATLRQSGKQLELLVKSGKLFFNVSKKLSAKESMNVRTSTMVTGVRGTCGVVEYVSSKQSKLYLIEGQVTLGTGSNATVVQGGQVATVILQDKPATTDPGKPDKGDQNVIAVEKLTEKNIPPVALQEIVADPVLQEKIEKTTELKIEKIEEALAQFEKEEAERIEQEKAEQEKDEQEKDKENENKDKEESATGSSDSSSSSDSSGSGGATVTETTLNGTVTPGAIQAAFQNYQRVHIGTDAIMQFSEGDILTIPGGRMLHIWGKKKIPKTVPINVGDGKTKGLLCVMESASLSAGTINVEANSRLEDHGTLECERLNGGANTLIINNNQLKVNETMHLSNGTTYENHGSLNGKKLTSDGGATIKNTSVMNLSDAYTSEGTDTYGDNPEALLISTKLSTGMPTGNQNGSLLMSANNSYYYARSINQRVLENMKLVEGVTWQFAKNAEISAAVEFAGFKADMGENELQIKGTLALSGSTNITGTGSATVRLMSGGKLILSDGNTSTTSSVIENTESGYAIAFSGGTLEWNDTGCSFDGGDVGKAIAAATASGSNTRAELPSWVTVKTGYVPMWTGSQIKLQITTDFTNGKVTADELNLSLSTNQTVTVGPAASASISASETIRVPAGKMLNIQSAVTKVDTEKYTGGFYLNGAGARIVLEDNATLNVTGYVGGNGIIQVGQNQGASVFVNSGANLSANQLNLRAKSNVSNAGIIDVGTISTDGVGTITNENLIKTKVFTANNGKYSYSENATSVLICNSDLSNSLNNTSESLLVYASASNTSDQQYFYAQRLNELMVTRMNSIGDKSGIEAFKNNANNIVWNFKKTAVVYGQYTIENKFNASLEGNELQIAEGGKLTIKSVGEINGNGAAVIRLNKGGILLLENGAPASGNISNNNTEKGFAIAIDDVSETSTTRIEWKDTSVSICTATNEISNAIQGLSYSDDGGLVNVKYLSCTGTLSWDVNKGVLALAES